MLFSLSQRWTGWSLSYSSILSEVTRFCLAVEFHRSWRSKRWSSIVLDRFRREKKRLGGEHDHVIEKDHRDHRTWRNSQRTELTAHVDHSTCLFDQQKQVRVTVSFDWSRHDDRCVSIHSLIKINRWKFQTVHSSEVRYWYEPDGGNMGKGWNFDAVAFLAYSKRELGTQPVYSFHSETAGEWSNTLQLDSTPPMIGTEHWISDGISFYTYPTLTNSHELQPVWRYWNALKNSTSHKRLTFLVVDKTDFEQERIGWMRDQVLFYALPYEAWRWKAI